MLARIHEEMLNSVEHLDPATQGAIMLAYIKYQIKDIEPSDSDPIVYAYFKAKQFDLDSMKMDVKASITNGASGWRPAKTFENSQKPKITYANLAKPNVTWEREREWEWKVEIENKNKTNEKKKFMDFVFLTESEHTHLVEKFWLTKTNYWIDRLNSYIGQIGVGSASKKYKSHYFTILNRERREWGKSSGDYAKEQALARHREKIREQIDDYLYSTGSEDVWPKKQVEAFDRRGEVLGT